MSIPETVLIFAGAPLAIIVAAFASVYLPSEAKAPARYRPGRPWIHPPAWYLPHQLTSETTHSEQVALPAATSSLPVAAKLDAVGGASGEW
jgi:hypothetical protein